MNGKVHSPGSDVLYDVMFLVETYLVRGCFVSDGFWRHGLVMA